MKVKVSRTETDVEQYIEVEINDCTAIEALTIIDALFNPVTEEEVEIPTNLIH